MTAPDIVEHRLRQQCLTGAAMKEPAQVVGWLGAMQAQEYLPARWGLALRLAGAPTSADLEAAINRGEILRTHILRPTWHFVTPADIRWMLALTGPRVRRTMASYARQQNLDAPRLNRAIALIERTLAGRSLTRPAVGVHLARQGIPVTGVALSLAVMAAELEGVICSGPFDGRHLTYALIDERAPKVSALTGDEAVAELTRRFFQSHGPATLRDFAWWSGLTMADGRRGLEIIRGRRLDVDGLAYWTVGPRRPARPARSRVHLLPIYDEYVVAYRDRVVVPHASPTTDAAAPAIVFQHAVVIDGQIAGTWRTTRSRDRSSVDVIPIRALTAAERKEVAAEIERYTRFVKSDGR